jgi:hypothetical protein
MTRDQTDKRIREIERAAAAGDPDAQAQLDQWTWRINPPTLGEQDIRERMAESQWARVATAAIGSIRSAHWNTSRLQADDAAEHIIKRLYLSKGALSVDDLMGRFSEGVTRKALRYLLDYSKGRRDADGNAYSIPMPVVKKRSGRPARYVLNIHGLADKPEDITPDTAIRTVRALTRYTPMMFNRRQAWERVANRKPLAGGLVDPRGNEVLCCGKRHSYCCGTYLYTYRWEPNYWGPLPQAGKIGQRVNARTKRAAKLLKAMREAGLVATAKKPEPLQELTPIQATAKARAFAKAVGKTIELMDDDALDYCGAV